MRDSARRVDGGGDAVIGRAQNPTPVLGRAHTHQQQMLLARRTAAEVAVVRQIHQHLGAFSGEPAHQIRERRFVTDEDAGGARGRLGHRQTLTRSEVAGLLRDAVHPTEERRNVLAERHQIHLVVAARKVAALIQQNRGVERRAGTVVSYRAEDQAGRSSPRQLRHQLAHLRIFVVVDRHRHFRPQDQPRPRLPRRERAAQGKHRQTLLGFAYRFESPALSGRQVRLHHHGILAARHGFRQRRQQEDQRRGQNPSHFLTLAVQQHQRDGDVHCRYHKRHAVDARVWRQTHRRAHIGGRIAEREPCEPQRSVQPFHHHPQRRHHRDGVPAPYGRARHPRERAHVQRLGQDEQAESAVAAPHAHAAVHFQHPANPVTDAVPIHQPRQVSPQEAQPGPLLARHGHQ